jgi:hypothetical protein
MFPLKTFVSDVWPRICWHKFSPHRGVSKDNHTPYIKRYRFGNAFAANPETKRSEPFSKLGYDETNNRLPKSVVG